MRTHAEKQWKGSWNMDQKHGGISARNSTSKDGMRMNTAQQIQKNGLPGKEGKGSPKRNL